MMKPEQFLEKPDENLMCTICKGVFEDPVNCKEGHSFCSECIKNWVNTRNQCPVDKKVIFGFNFPRNDVLCRIINKLQVYCQPPAENPGLVRKDDETKCDWTGNLKDFKTHREMCPFQQVKCPQENCNKLIQKKDLEEHDRKCEHKNVKCDEKCGLAVPRRELPNHKKYDCPEVQVPCPNKCIQILPQDPSAFSSPPLLLKLEDSMVPPPGMAVPVKIKRKDLIDHITNTCERTVVPCPFKEHGCLVDVLRGDLNEHIQENMSAHSVAEQTSKLFKQLDQKITSHCETLQNRIFALEKQCSTLTETNAQLKEELNRTKEEVSSYVWTIHEYPILSKRHGPHGSCFKSPTFILCGYKWFLQLYPNGDDDVVGFMSLYLCMDDLIGASRSWMLNAGIPSGEVSVNYTLTVKSRVPGEDVYYKSNAVFDKVTLKIPHKKFMMSSEALSQKYCDYAKNNLLVVKCTIYNCN